MIPFKRFHTDTQASLLSFLKKYLSPSISTLFFQNLDISQQKQFIQTFRSKADHIPPYEMLVSCCQTALPV